MPTSYDNVAYPTGLIAALNPERHAALATLAGLDPVPPARARILEIGGGDCLNILAMAATWPDCETFGFDLSASAIARGQRLADRAGLANAALATDDIMTAAARYPARAFDYVIVHGVYAWVPETVRDALMALVAHVLSDRGVAFVSYNALPGGHLRCLMRDMVRDTITDVTGPAERLEAARAFLQTYLDQTSDDERPLVRAMRTDAARMLDRPDAVLFHDELGEVFAPQSLRDVAAAGARHGLAWLTDASSQLRLEGFVAADHAGPVDLAGTDLAKAALATAAAGDYRALRTFRQSLFVRGGAPVARRLDPARIAPLWLSTRLQPAGERSFTFEQRTIRLADPAFAEALARAARVTPQRVPVAEFAQTDEARRALLTLFGNGMIELFVSPAPFADRAGERPCSSPLARAMIAEGAPALCNLNHAMVRIDQPELRTLLTLADGTRTVARIAAMQSGVAPVRVGAVLDDAARQALIAGSGP